MMAPGWPLVSGPPPSPSALGTATGRRIPSDARHAASTATNQSGEPHPGLIGLCRPHAGGRRIGSRHTGWQWADLPATYTPRFTCIG